MNTNEKDFLLRVVVVRCFVFLLSLLPWYNSCNLNIAHEYNEIDQVLVFPRLREMLPRTQDGLRAKKEVLVVVVWLVAGV